MRKVLVILTMCLAFTVNAMAQLTVTGRVTGEDGLGIPGASVLEKGTTNGTVTNVDGNYSLRVGNDATLVFSFMGYTAQEIPVQGRSTVNVTLALSSLAVDEVVVTALGISRERKALGYAMTEIKGDDLVRANVVNPVTGLQGKVAGVQINQGAGGPQSANRILIRGNTSLGVNNQPIFVVDGVIIDNSVTANTEWGSQLDFGNEIKNLNSDDFESISVLKGAAATALYGSRAANGVILITTKKGKKSDGLGVSVTQSMTWDNVYAFPDFQNVYGTGLYPAWPLVNGAESRNTSETLNFGPKFDGKSYTRGGKEYMFAAQKDNVKQMYQTGTYRNTNVALQGGDEKGTFRFSFSNLGSNGTTLNNEFERNSLSLNTSRQISSRLKADAGFAYVNSNSKNPVFQGGGRSPIYDFMYSVPRDYDTRYWLQNYKNPNGDGYNREDPYSYSRNIWLYLENNYLQQDLNFRSYLSVDIKLLDWLTLTAKGDMNNLFLTREDKILADGQANYIGAGYQIQESKKDQYKLTGMLSANKTFGDFSVYGTVAAEQWDTRRAYLNSWTVSGLRVPGVFDLSNSVRPAQTDGRKYTDRKRINSVFAFINADYKGQIYLDVTGRNDWSSTLIYSDGSGNVSYFYPSVSGSWLFSETYDMPSFVSFGKLRGSYAIVGNDTQPYLTSIGYYRLDGTFTNAFDNQEYASYSFDSNALRNTDLKPEKQHSLEFGADVKFFNHRLGIDLAYYKTNTMNQILALAQPAESGVNSRWINAGNIQNSGLELVVTATPLRINDFSWDLTANYTRNRNKIIELAPNVEKYRIEGGGMDLASWATVGGAYGDIYTPYAYRRDENGQKLLNAAGGWIRSGTEEKVGTIQPDFLGGLLSTFRFKNLALNMLLDSRFGGHIASGTYNYGRYSGALASTLYGRDQENGGLPRTLPDGRVLNDGMIPDGVFISGTVINGVNVSGMTYQKAYNDGLVGPLSAYQYYNNMHSWGSGIREETILETSWIAFRELSLQWAVPQSWARQIALSNVNVGLLIRNLGYLYNSLPDNIHPEGLPNNRSSAFVEVGGAAYTRSYGFNINVSF
jgi:iron complex outermembrane recepter protein